MDPHYRHRQIAWVIVGSILAGLLLVVPIVAIPDAPPGAALIPGGLLLFGGLLFSTLTVTVDRDELRVRFTGGIVRRRVALAEIREYRAVRNPWRYGWGIHRIPGGWIWNASGWEAVELRLRDGSVLRVGTDEPDALLHAIEMVAPRIDPAPLETAPVRRPARGRRNPEVA